MGMINLVSIYEEIYKGTSHCAMCYRSCKRIRLVRSQVFKKIVEAISSNIVVQNATLCYKCEAHMTKFAYFLDSIQMVLDIHKLFMKAETTRKNIPLETKLMEQNVKLYEKKLMQFREQIDFQRTETMIVDFVESDKRLRKHQSAPQHKDTNVQPIKEKMNIFSTKKTVKKQNIDKEIITINIPPVRPQIPTTPTVVKNTNHPIAVQPKTQSKNTKKIKPNLSKPIKVTSNQTSSRILTQYKRPYMPVLTIDGSSGSPQTRYPNVPLLPNPAMDRAIEESKKKISKILLPTMVCRNESLKESIIDLEKAKRIYEGEPAMKKNKLNTPKIYMVDNKYLDNQILAKSKTILIKNDNVIKSPTKITTADKSQSILPKIIECKTDTNAFDARQETDGVLIKGEIDWEAKIPSELTTFVDCGDRWPLDVLKDENIDNEDSIDSIIEVDNIEGDETSIIIVESQNNSRCSVCDVRVTTETLKEHFINVHMKPPV